MPGRAAQTPLLAALSTPFEHWADLPLEPVEIAVVDSGVDATHPDLAGRVARAYAVAPEEGKPVWSEVPAGIDNDVFGHGTAVAGIIARLAPNARIIDIRVLGGDNQGTAACLLKGLEEAVRHGFPIINLSLALSGRFAAEARPLCEAAWRQGQVVVSAKRNIPIVDLGLPAEFATSVGVDNLGPADAFRYLFRAGEIIEFATGGEHAAAPAKGGGYKAMVGTSFATPVLSAVCALMLGAFPGLLPFEVRSVLKHHAAPPMEKTG